MARLMAAASGNFSTSGTWVQADSTALVSNSAGSTTLTTSSQNSASFQPGNVTVDAVALRLASRAAGTPTNTLTVVLYNVTSSSAVATVNVPVADLPACAAGTGTYGGWVLISLGGSVALSAGINYQVRLNLNNTSTAVAFLNNGTAANWQHLLRTTTAAAPSSADDLYILGLWTSSGTWTTYDVTMDITTTSTTYGSNPGVTTVDKAAGGIAIGRGSLVWNNTSGSTAALKLAGPVLVQGYGTLSLGTDAAPCDRNATMELQFATTSGYGIIAFDQPSVAVNLVGQSRTAGKAVSQVLLTADMTSGSTTTASVNADTGWKNGDTVFFGSSRPQTGTDAAGYTLSGDATSGSIVLSAAVSANYKSEGIPCAIVLRTRNVNVTSDANTRCPEMSQYGQAVWTWRWCSLLYCKVTIAANVAGGTITMDHVVSDNNTGNIGASPWSISGAVAGNTISLTNLTLINTNNSYVYQFAGTTNANLTGLTVTDVVTITDAANVGGYGTLPLSAVASLARIRMYGGNGQIGWTGYSGTGTLTNAMLGGTYWVCGAGNPAWSMPSSTPLIEGLTFDDVRLAGAYCFGVAVARNVTFTNGYFLPDLYVVSAVADQLGDFTFVNCRMGGWGGSTPAGLVNCNSAAKLGVKLTLQGCTLTTSSPYSQFDGKLVNFVATGAPGYQQDIQISLVHCAGVADTGDIGSITTTSTCAFTDDSYASFHNYNGTSGSHRLYRLYPNAGLIQSEASIYRTAAPSERMSPNAAARKLLSSPKRYALAAGDTATVSTYVYIDGTYNGAAPRLLLRANAAAGFNQDTTLATHGGSTGSFVQLSSGFSVANDTVVEVCVDCDGTTGSIYVDDWSVT